MFKLKNFFVFCLCSMLMADLAFSTHTPDEDDSSASSIVVSDVEESDSGETAAASLLDLGNLQDELKKLGLGDQYLVNTGNTVAVFELIYKPDTSEAELRKTANAGDRDAMNKLALLLEQRYEKSKAQLDATEAIYWYRYAAERGHVPSMHDLTRCYKKGICCTASAKDAYYWGRKALKVNGAALDKLNLANLLLHGVGTPSSFEDKAEALQLMRELGEGKDLNAITSVVSMLEKGVGCARDAKAQEEMNYWLRKGAELGDPKCILSLSSRLIMGHGCKANDATQKEAFAVLMPLVNSGDVGAKTIIGFMLLQAMGCDATAENAAKGVEYLEQAAAAGDQGAMLNLGRYLMKNWKPGMNGANEMRAFKLFESARCARFCEATYAYAYCLEMGIGRFRRDEKKILADQTDAHMMYSQAALDGHERAEDNLIYCLMFGIGCDDTKEEKEEAFTLLTQGNQTNSAFRNYCLGFMYATGCGVAPDMGEAMQYLKPYEFADGVCPLILYIHLSHKDYTAARQFYLQAQKQGANLVNDPVLLGYLDFKIRLQSQKNATTGKKGKNKSAKNEPANDEFSEEAIRRDVEDVLKQFVALRDDLKGRLAIIQRCKEPSVQPGPLLDEMNELFVEFANSFKSAELTFRRIEIDAFVSSLSQLQEEVFLAGLKKEYMVIKDNFSAMLRIAFQLNMMRGSSVERLLKK